MKIAIVGPGGIGSTFAFQLSQAGHEVTVVARGKRLEQLQRDEAIVSAAGKRAAVRVSAALDTATAWDLVLVTVLAPQVDVVLPALAESAARTVMFMFNTFEPLGRLRDAVGSARFAFGFPAILATLEDGKLTSKIVTRGMVTPVTDAAWAKVFTDAGIPAVVHPDMESWLRTHAALVVPVMVATVMAHERKAGVSWTEAMGLARAMEEGLGLVRRLGNSITPEPMVILSRLPTPAVATLLWTLSRLPNFRKLGAAGPVEPRALIDAMDAAAPGQTPALLAIRP
ncbi:ketopantoate reductase family protein [Sorangium sp. So ce131]|uniref:ketopantoate reductase family protein n=1 Tax=Sorangium sp. So ce131 TaxID=3133282 RepID=UPI003F5FE9BD